MKATTSRSSFLSEPLLTSGHPIVSMTRKVSVLITNDLTLMKDFYRIGIFYLVLIGFLTTTFPQTSAFQSSTILPSKFAATIRTSGLCSSASSSPGHPFKVNEIFGLRRHPACPRRFSTCLSHTGHSHSHHHHHHEENNTKQNETTKVSETTKWIRRFALWICSWMATCGVTLMKHKKLTSQDWIAFGVYSLVLSSAQKLQRMFANALLRFQKLKDGVVKHSSFPNQNNKIGSGNSATAQAVAAIRNSEEADRVTWLGVVINLLLSIGKLVVGIAQNSSVLIADAGHSLSDLVSDFITLWSMNVARLPPDDDHPYGHYKFEAIGSLFLSLTLLMTGLSVGLHSQSQLLAILRNRAVTASSASNMVVPGPLALFVAGCSILSKEWLFRITKTVGEKLNSPIVIANAWHHRSDAYSSVLALLSIGWAMAGFPAADAAAGMLVAGMIGVTGGDILVESVKQLSDSAHEELQQEVQGILNSLRDDDVLSTTSIRARQVGSAAVAEVTVEISPDLSTTATRAVEERTQQYLRKELSSGHSGRSVIATVHAKPNLIVCPLLNQQQRRPYEDEHSHDHDYANDIMEGKSNDTSRSLHKEEIRSNQQTVAAAECAISASQMEHEVRQQALLLFPRTHIHVTGVTVHFSSQNTVSVDCSIQIDEEYWAKEDEGGNGGTSLRQVQEQAHYLQRALESNLSRIESARIYLDLNICEKTTRDDSSAKANDPFITAG